MELERAVLRHTDLYRQVNLVGSSLSALSHNIPPKLDARGRPRDVGRGLLKTRRLQFRQRFRFGNDNANYSLYRKYLPAYTGAKYLLVHALGVGILRDLDKNLTQFEAGTSGAIRKFGGGGDRQFERKVNGAQLK